MEDDEKVRYTFMVAIVFMVYQATFDQMLLSNTVLGDYELFKWVGLVTALLLLIAILLFAIDGIVLNIVPDKITKLIAWIGVLLAVLIIMIFYLFNSNFLDLDIISSL